MGSAHMSNLGKCPGSLIGKGPSVMGEEIFFFLLFLSVDNYSCFEIQVSKLSCENSSLLVELFYAARRHGVALGCQCPRGAGDTNPL